MSVILNGIYSFIRIYPIRSIVVINADLNVDDLKTLTYFIIAICTKHILFS